MKRSIKLALIASILTLMANIAVAQTPTDAEGWFKLGNEQLTQKKYMEAVNSYTQCISLSNKAAACYLNRGNSYDNLGKYNEATSDFSKAIELNPKYASAIRNVIFMAYLLRVTVPSLLLRHRRRHRRAHPGRIPRHPGEAVVEVSHDLEKMAEDASVVRLVNQLLQEAIGDRATDIHFEADRDGVSIRRRIDGVLYDTHVPRNIRLLYPAIVSRIKLMSGLDIVERRLPQDGRASRSATPTTTCASRWCRPSTARTWSCECCRRRCCSTSTSWAPPTAPAPAQEYIHDRTASSS